MYIYLILLDSECQHRNIKLKFESVSIGKEGLHLGDFRNLIENESDIQLKIEK